MRRLVVGAEVIASWFATGERTFLDEYRAGLLHIYAPPTARQELINRLVARNLRNAEGIISAVDRIGLELIEPPAEGVGRWMRRGLRVDAASYAALAESLEAPLVTRDPELRAAAAPLLLRTGEISRYPHDIAGGPHGTSGYPTQPPGGKTDAAR